MAIKRVFVISDLHIGGNSPSMLGHPEKLISFLDQIAEHQSKTEMLIELVINGDFIDFLAEPPFQAWTDEELAARTKLYNTFDKFKAVFDALANCAQQIHQLTILLGNHDIELAYPKLREAVLRRLGVDNQRCRFIINNEVYQIGDLLIEHGNRYDGWNAIDHDGLRRVVSAASRGEKVIMDSEIGMDICPGSWFVYEVINPLKERYHFVDLLKPETKIVPLLLAAIEPSLKADLQKIGSFVNNYVDQWLRTRPWNYQVEQGHLRLVASDDELPEQKVPEIIQDNFADELAALNSNLTQVGVVNELVKLFLRKAGYDSLKTLIEENRDIEKKRLLKLQAAVIAKLTEDTTFEIAGDDGPYVSAARRMTNCAVAKVVTMGHTHHARDTDLGNNCRYINTGTWADIIQVPPGCLEKTDNGLVEFEAWLRKLVLNDPSTRDANPACADLFIDESGAIVNDRFPLIQHFNDGLVL